MRCFPTSPCDNHRDALIWMLSYIKDPPQKGLLYVHRNYVDIVANRELIKLNLGVLIGK